jgi:Icc-related predicted phosphoesterase
MHKILNILHISDTHGFHHRLDIKPGYDLIVHSGDVSNSIDPALSFNEIRDFLEWFEALDIPEKILVPGNHDVAIWKGMITVEDLAEMGIEMLINQSLFVYDLHIWGSPYTPRLYDHYTNWAWGLKRQEMDKVWNLIPNNLDILITHGPPKGILDLTLDRENQENAVQAGDKVLFNKVLEKKPKIHMFGHIHEERGFLNAGIRNYHNIIFSNGSCAGRSKLELVNHGNAFSL